MHADLERLIALQALDSQAHDAERVLAGEPERTKALDARLEHARTQVKDAKDRLAANQSARRDLEKNAAVHQGRLSKYREQAMNVKTNQEYHAIQHEIAFAQGEIKTIEDQELELMMSADEMAAAIKTAESALAADQKDVDTEKKAIAADVAQKRAALEHLKRERLTVTAGLTPSALATFELVSKRRQGIAMAEARDGVCVICHVRMRPQVFNTVRRNEDVIQCESCQRILYFVAAPAASPASSS